MKHITTILLAGSAAILMTACGGGGSTDDTPVVDVNANGLWSGIQTINGIDYDLQVITYNRNIVGFSYGAASMFAGVYVMTGDEIYSEYKAYDNTGYYITEGSITGTVIEESSVNATFSNDAGQNGSISGTFSTQYNNSSSLDYIEGNHVGYNYDISVISGEISGTSNGCNVFGKITVPDESVNIYEVGYTLSDCLVAGTYIGIGSIITDTSGSTSFIAGASNADRMDLFTIPVNP